VLFNLFVIMEPLLTFAFVMEFPMTKINKNKKSFPIKTRNPYGTLKTHGNPLHVLRKT